MMTQRTRVRRAQPNEFEYTTPPATMPQTDRFVPAIRQRSEIVPVESNPIVTAETQLMMGGQHLAEAAMAGRTAHSRAQQSDTAITHAQAHLLASAPVVGSLVVVTTGLILLGWLLAGGPFIVWLSIELVIVGAGAVVALHRSRRAGLEHTPAGVERHEIDARTKVAMYAIDRHCEMVERMKGVRE